MAKEESEGVIGRGREEVGKESTNDEMKVKKSNKGGREDIKEGIER